MNAPEAPPAPDPVATAKAQSESNVKSAVAQYGLNATNQRTPSGNLTYNQIGTWEDGTPRFEVVQEYSPAQQGLFNLGEQTSTNLGQVGVEQSDKIRNILNTPYNIDASRGEKLSDINRTFLDPQWNRRDEALKTELFNSGIRPGSEAYKNAQTDQADQRQRAYDQMYLDSYGQANQAALTERNQPINEITALMRGAGVSQPNFVSNTPTAGIAPTDVIGAQQQSLNQQNVGFQAQQAQNQAMIGGMFGLGKAAIGGAMTSDRRAKTDIVRVGELARGLPLYAFRYLAGGPMQIGLMAQDVELVIPEAVVIMAGGLKGVDYGMVADRIGHG